MTISPIDDSIVAVRASEAAGALNPALAFRKATLRMVTASFAAGAGLMLCLGLIAPLASQGAFLDVRSAEASAISPQGPLIEPLDVDAIHAQLASAERTMQAARAVTDDDIARLARLTPH